MANMHYCRFQNTVQDLVECEQALDDGELHEGQLSPDEADAAQRLIRLCHRIADEYDGED